MVVDIGGGTTDVAVIALGGIVASTSVKCAGDRLDHAIADYIKKTCNLSVGEKMAENVKIAVGSAVPVEDELTMVVRGRDSITGALLLSPARSVHTFGMRFPIDVAHLSKDLEVLSITTMVPNRLGAPRFRSHSVVEAAAGAFDRWSVVVGDRLEIR